MKRAAVIAMVTAFTLWGCGNGNSGTGGATGGDPGTGGDCVFVNCGTGGVSTGGVSTGGVSTGGVSTGGVSTGGVSTGGVSTGGVSTGGVSTGGVSTGGTSTGGSSGTGGMEEGCVPDDTCQQCPRGECESDDDCTGGQVCATTGCNVSTCIPAGARCQVDEDCAPGATCESHSFGAVIVRWCVQPGGGCTDSRDCPIGYACEGGGCVDRAIPCSLYCPHGYVCQSNARGKICVHGWTPCEGNNDCQTTGGACEDVDDDGSTECTGTLRVEMDEEGNYVNVPCTNDACAAGQACELKATASTVTCGDFGICADGSDCPAGSTCVDTWGEGRKECVRLGGSCLTNADCAPGSVCGTDFRSNDPPTCMTEGLGSGS